MSDKPKVIDTKVLANTRIFKIEEMRVQFSNGHESIFERVSGRYPTAVMIVPMQDDETFLLIREYAAAAEQYTLGFAKGAVDTDEKPLEAANRELMEEVGFGAHELTEIADWSLSPAYFNANMKIVLAKQLYPQKREGDEPEPIEIVPWKIKDIDKLLAHPEFTESRSVAAVLLLERMYRESTRSA